MKQVYSHPQLVMVSQMRNLLERAGIETQVRNEYASGAIGELAPIDAWPELWVVRDGDAERAGGIITELQTRQEQPDWQCDACGNLSPATFDFCWHCGEARSEH